MVFLIPMLFVRPPLVKLTLPSLTLTLQYMYMYNFTFYIDNTLLYSLSMKKPWNSCEIPMNPSFSPWIIPWFFLVIFSWVSRNLTDNPWISHEIIPNRQFHCNEKMRDAMKYGSLCIILSSLPWKKKSLAWLHHDCSSILSWSCHELELKKNVMALVQIHDHES